MSIFRNVFNNLHKRCFQTLKYSTTIESNIEEFKPIIDIRSYDSDRYFHKSREVWLENLDTVEEKKLGLINLHAEIFAAQPRVDIIHENVKWQRLYSYVSYAHTKTRAEVRGGGKKPWKQKGTGRARHGSIRSPLWRKGGVIHGPRSHTTHFYMLPFYTRIAGLTSTLSVKFAQDDLHLVNDLEIPSEESSYIEQLIVERNWGPSVLIVDSEDIMPINLTIATDTIPHVNLMPVYGLNVYSMLKHDTLVLTHRAARLIEEKLLFHLNRADSNKFLKKFQLSQQ
ncbi:39S ribosomal protein L4, mitochondrial [Vespa crabro]|uniref:39S ribosomal protein L4, mitochondrial n=1 Tax=Vespa crabro TaxID=7445 RepID=UPI001F021307|nr:39S ribosomal protein L4, mitochondrial [Vespa crabro]